MDGGRTHTHTHLSLVAAVLNGSDIVIAGKLAPRVGDVDVAERQTGGQTDGRAERRRGRDRAHLQRTGADAAHRERAGRRHAVRVNRDWTCRTVCLARVHHRVLRDVVEEVAHRPHTPSDCRGGCRHCAAADATALVVVVVVAAEAGFGSSRTLKGFRIGCLRA